MDWNIICFDLDNTLFDYEKTFQQTMEHCFQKLSNRWKNPNQISSEDWFLIFKKYCDLHWSIYAEKKITKKQYRRLRFLDTMRELQIQADENVADELQANFEKVVGHFVAPYHGMHSLLSKLKEQDISLGIITNGRKRIQEEKVANLPFYYLFPKDTIVISESIGFEKPNHCIFDEAFQRVSVEKSKPLYIGDSWEQDIVGAKEAGWDAIYFNSRKIAPKTNHNVVSICETANELRATLL